jgi:hypothetical protein
MELAAKQEHSSKMFEGVFRNGSGNLLERIGTARHGIVNGIGIFTPIVSLCLAYFS